MFRTQILLEEWQYRQLKQISASQKRSLSEILRTWISEKLKKTQRSEKDPLFTMAGTLKKEFKTKIDSSKLDSHIYKKDW